MNFQIIFFVLISAYTATAEVTCGPDDTFLVNPVDCGSFYQCSNGVPYLQTCPPSLVFDPSLNVCVWRFQYNCTELVTTEPTGTITEPTETITRPTETITETTETIPEPTETVTQPPESSTTEPSDTIDPCYGLDDTYVVNPADCSSFYQCSNGVSYLIHCPLTHNGSLVFDPSLNECVWPSDYDCVPTELTTQPPDSTTEPPESTTEPTESTTEPTETVTEPTETVTEPTETITETTETISEPTATVTQPPESSTTEPSDTIDPCYGLDDTYVVNPADCSSFYQCSNGVSYLIHCPLTHNGSLVFDPSLNKCVWPSDYDCVPTELTTQPPDSTTEPPESTTEPTESTTEPTESTTEPTESTTEPTESTTEPTESTTEPTESTTEPTESTTEPTESTTEPTESTTEPTESTTEPTESTTEPTESTTEPTESTTEPTESTTEPTESTTQPPEPTAEPPETLNPCHEFRHPSTCLASPHECSFCFDTCFHDGTVDMPRCDTYDNLVGSGCHTFSVNRTEYDSVVKTSPDCSSWIPLEPGKKRKFSVTFSLEKHPLDLYYLMDFSGSMADDKRNVVALSSSLLSTLANLTDDFRIGFGTFVDKPIHPFGAYGDYSFHNDFPLNSETDGLVQKIDNIPIMYGSDDPESHGDALAQVIECAEEIGWRENSRHVVLLATDIDFHVAGHGQAANIFDPYVEGCYLDSHGAYTEELTMDYPSIEQLAAAYSKKQATTTVIFATSSETVPFYEDVAAQFKSAYVGILKADSSNVLELIKNEFAKIESRMEIEKSDTSDSVSFRFFSNCMSSDDERETTICEYLPNAGDVTFTVEIDLSECPKNPDETGVVFNLNPVGLPIFIEVELSYLCD